MTSPNTGSAALDAIIKEALRRVVLLPPKTRAAMRRDAAIDWAYGNLTCTGRRPYITRELVAAQYDEMVAKGRVEI